MSPFAVAAAALWLLNQHLHLYERTACERERVLVWVLLRLQQARGRKVQENTFEVGRAGRGGKEYFTYKFSSFAWSMPVCGMVRFFYAAVFESLRPRKNRML